MRPCLALLILSALGWGQNATSPVAICVSASASGTAYTCSTANTLLAYQTGSLASWTPDTTNTGTTPTLNLGPGAKTLVTSAGGALTISQIIASTPYLVVYDGTNLRLTAPIAGVASGPFLQQLEMPVCSEEISNSTSMASGVTASNVGSLFGNGDGSCFYNLSTNGLNYTVWHRWIPSTWDGSTLSFVQIWMQNQGVGTGNIQWSLSTYCANPLIPASPVYNAAQLVTTAVPVAVNSLATTTWSSLTLTGCAAGSQLYVKVANIASGSGGTTYTGTPSVLSGVLSIKQ